jgi:Fur family ferric uptake transcriptional regulator
MSVQTRNTKQKQAIRDAFVAADRPLAFEEVLELATRQVEGISIATVYRNVNSLVDEQWLVPVEIPGMATRYELAGKEHHHHFKCNDCGKLFELKGCDVQIRPKLPRGFRTTGHEFFVYGLCARCA